MSEPSLRDLFRHAGASAFVLLNSDGEIVMQTPYSEDGPRFSPVTAPLAAASLGVLDRDGQLVLSWALGPMACGETAGLSGDLNAPLALTSA
jgi:hypothetical protein